MPPCRTPAEIIALSLLARDGIAAIWGLHLSAALAYRDGERPWRLGLLRLPTPRSASGCAQRPPLRDRPVSLCPQLRAVSCGGTPPSAASAGPRAPETGRPLPRPYARRTIAPQTRSRSSRRRSRRQLRH